MAKHEKKIEKHDGEIKLIFDDVRKLMTPPEPNKKKIEFFKLMVIHSSAEAISYGE